MLKAQKILLAAAFNMKSTKTDERPHTQTLRRELRANTVMSPQCVTAFDKGKHSIPLVNKTQGHLLEKLDTSVV